jgi:hypothetical protein
MANLYRLQESLGFVHRGYQVSEIYCTSVEWVLIMTVTTIIILVAVVVVVAAATAVATRMGVMNSHKILVRKPEGMKPLGGLGIDGRILLGCILNK